MEQKPKTYMMTECYSTAQATITHITVLLHYYNTKNMTRLWQIPKILLNFKQKNQNHPLNGWFTQALFPLQTHLSCFGNNAKKSGLPFLTSRCENNTRSNRSKYCESIIKIIWATLRCHGAHCAVSVYPVLWPARDTPICISDSLRIY